MTPTDQDLRADYIFGGPTRFVCAEGCGLIYLTDNVWTDGRGGYWHPNQHGHRVERLQLTEAEFIAMRRARGN